jgi:hypothetical protein
MKENLKVEIESYNERIKISNLLELIQPSWKPLDIFRSSGARYAFIDLNINNLSWHDVEHKFINSAFKKITIKDLVELAKPREYLDENFKLVVTNQPKEGYILVPDGADTLTIAGKDLLIFWKTLNESAVYLDIGVWDSCEYNLINNHLKVHSGAAKILWQRTQQQETIMKEEKKGRFLHQWAYEAFGRGEDLEYIFNTNPNDVWEIVNYDNVLLNIFNDSQTSFRLKPQTITIGSRTINKPISVKPEMGTEIFWPELTHTTKFGRHIWQNTPLNNRLLKEGLLFLTAFDAITITDAFLELINTTNK